MKKIARRKRKQRQTDRMMDMDYRPVRPLKGSENGFGSAISGPQNCSHMSISEGMK